MNNGKKRGVLFLLTRKSKRIIMVGLIAVLLLALANSIIFASLSSKDKNPLEGRSIIIDPGHGGIDGGTNDGVSFFEKDINLMIAKKLYRELSAKKVNVGLTRESDVSLDSHNPSSKSRHLEDLTARVLQFNSGSYDIFVSIHVNHSPNSRTKGPFVLYSANLPRAGFLAASIQARLNEHAGRELNTGITRSPVESNYFLFKHSDIPGVIVETGFISNETEKRLLADEAYQQKLAECILSGIKDYYENLDKFDAGEIWKETDSPMPDIIDDIQLVKLPGGRFWRQL